MASDKKKSEQKAGKASGAKAESGKKATAETPEEKEAAAASAKARLAATGRNDPCPCGSGKKYKKCHLPEDEGRVVAAIPAPDPQSMVLDGWRLFEQRRPGAAERQFRAALDASPDLVDARVGIGMARLSSGDSEGAKTELELAAKAGEPGAARLREEGVKDAFSRPEAQAYIRACHALGCLAFDQGRFADSVADLEKVYSIDEATVGTEARLIAAKSLMRLERAADAIAVLGPAAASEGAASRVKLGLGLAHFAAGDAAAARQALGEALDANPHFGKAVLGKIRKRVDNPAAAQPGTTEEALVYSQTYGDVWTDEAKKFLEELLVERTAKRSASAG